MRTPPDHHHEREQQRARSSPAVRLCGPGLSRAPADINGVSEVRIFGEKRYAMRLWMDYRKLAAYKATPLDVQTALNQENIELPAGLIEGHNVELTVRTRSRLETVEQFNNLILREENGQIVRFSDVGYAELGPENQRSISRGLAGPRVAIAVIPQPGSNHITIGDEFYRRIEQIKIDLPKISSWISPSTRPNTSAPPSRGPGDNPHRICPGRPDHLRLPPRMADNAHSRVRHTDLLIGTFFIMYLADLSINVLTLLGLVLAIGIVVTTPSSCWRTSTRRSRGGWSRWRLGSRGRGKSSLPSFQRRSL